MDNQNNQNGYTNFNGYQTAPEQQQPQQPQQTQQPQQPYQAPMYQNVGQPYQYNPNQQVPYNPYQVPLQQQSNHKSIVLGILAIVLPIISCSYLSPVGLILAIIGVIRNKKSAVSWVGLVISLLLCAFLGFIIYLVSNPDEYRAFLEMSGAYSQEQIDELMKSIYGLIIMNF